MRVLLVEDDDRLAHALADALTRRGHVVIRDDHVAQALRHVPAAEFVLLDLGLPDADGLEFLRHVRTASSVPVIVVTARSDERDIVSSLRSGADDYLVKPFRLAELLARMEAVLRRTTVTRPAVQPDVVRVGDTEINLVTREITVAGAEIPLTRREFDVLAVLAREPGVVRTREEIADTVAGGIAGPSRALDVHIAGIRGKTGRPGLIVTLRGYGYRLATSGA